MSWCPPASAGSSTITLCLPEQAELSPHGTDRVINTENTTVGKTLWNVLMNHRHYSWEQEIVHSQRAPIWNSQGIVWLDTSAACCGFCAVKLLGSHVQWLRTAEKGSALAHLGTKMTEHWTLWAVGNVFVKTQPYIFYKGRINKPELHAALHSSVCLSAVSHVSR